MTGAVVTVALIGCGQIDDPRADDEAPGTLVMSSKQRIIEPEVVPSEVATQVGGNSAFAVDLFHALRGNGDDNLFYSPFSISVALAMTHAGARGETEAQMAGALQYLLGQERLHPTFNHLDLELNSRGQGAQGADGEPFRLRVVNAIWGQEGYAFLPEFLDTLALNYGAGLQLLDFLHQTETARLAINDWVEGQTEGRIEELLPPSSLTPDARLVLTNAIYFNAAWKHKFEAELTSDAPFTMRDGSQVQVPMMHQTGSFRHALVNGCAALELPYDGDQLSMLLILPDAGELEAVVEGLSASFLDEMVGALQEGGVILSLPRWSFTSPSVSLKQVLGALGMPIAFVYPDADFSGMNGDRDLFIGNVLHKAFVDVNEAGTEAAAATAVIMESGSMPTGVELTFDRPFLYAIRDLATGTILFVGRVTDPRG